MSAHFHYLLHLADNALILGQRLSEWCGHGPVIEEDLALTNIALDLIGQARLLYAHAGKIEGKGRDEDQLAFLRTEGAYRNCTLTELPNGDFARTVLRGLLFSAWQQQLWAALRISRDAELAAIAEKSLKESRYHLQHCADWVVRLGDGTEESHLRTQSALDFLWPYTAEFFAGDDADRDATATGIGVAAATLEAGWTAIVTPVLEAATLTIPARTGFHSLGRIGRHSEHMGHLLAEMQYLQRAYPGAKW